MGLRLILVVAVALVLAGPASAARPRVDVEVAPGSGNARVVVVRLTKAGKPVRGATVVASAKMSLPGHVMTMAGVRLRQRGAGIYKGTIRFVMLGRWRITVVADAGRHGRARGVTTVTL